MSRPLHVYVHFPFCKSRCHYCAFYFVVGRAEMRERYVRAVEAEIERAAGDPRFAGRRVASVYLGGGTPSLMAPGTVAGVLDRVASAFGLEAGAEISLEANPEGLSLEDLRGWRAAGVRRLTLGWQSLRPEGLRALTRIHGVEDNVRSLERARAAGFSSVGVDLIFGWPGQTPRDWRAELEEAARLGPDHVSAYELTLEEGTRLFRRQRAGRFSIAGEEERARMIEVTGEVLAGAGIHRYEISNFARPGHECRHNLGGWRGDDLLGVGASAASHVENARWSNVPELDEYVRRIEAGEDPGGRPEVLDEETWAAEDLYLGLRTTRGIDAAARLARLSEAARARLESVLARAVGAGLAETERGAVRLTRRGLLLADSVFEELLAP